MAPAEIENQLCCLRKDIDKLIQSGVGTKGIVELTVQTYSAIQSYKFTSQPVLFEVITDENKTQSNTIYLWTGTKLYWGAFNPETFQPTL